MTSKQSLALLEEGLKEALSRMTRGACSGSLAQEELGDLPESVLAPLLLDLAEEIKTGVLLDFDALVQKYHLDQKLGLLDQIRSEQADDAQQSSPSSFQSALPVKIEHIDPAEVMRAAVIRAKLEERGELKKRLEELKRENDITMSSIKSARQHFNRSIPNSLIASS